MSNNIDKELLKLQNNNKFIIEGEKATLLLSEDTSNTQVLRELGWDEEIQKKEAIISKAVETKQMIDKFGENIFNQEKLIEFCIENNYCYDLLRDYKGPVPKELINIIKEYSEQNKTHIGNLREELIILAPFDYFKNESNYRNDKKLQQILILEKVSQEHRGNNETFYKIINKAGKRNKVKEWFKSLYQTHVGQLVQLEFTLYATVIAFIICLISYFSSQFGAVTIYTIPILIISLLIILIVKVITPTVNDQEVPIVSFNYHNHDGFTRYISDFRFKANSYYIGAKSNRNINDKSVLKIRLKYYITSLIGVILFVALASLFRHVSVLHKFTNNDTTRMIYLVGKCDSEHKEYINNSTIYHYIFYDKTSSLNYKVSEHHYDNRTKKFLD